MVCIFLAYVLAVVSADKIIILTLHCFSPDKIMLFAAVGTIDESTVFIDFTHTGLANSALAHLLNDIPSSLVDNRLMGILEAELFFLRNLDGTLIFERSNPCTAVDGVTEIDFVVKNIGNRALIPFVWVSRICMRSILTFFLEALEGWLENLLLQ